MKKKMMQHEVQISWMSSAIVRFQAPEGTSEDDLEELALNVEQYDSNPNFMPLEGSDTEVDMHTLTSKYLLTDKAG